MKKLLCVLTTALAVSTAAFFCACGGETQSGNSGTTPPQPDATQPEQPSLKNFTGLTFADKTITYDGAEHTVEIAGTLPEGAEIVYYGNTATNAGVYSATATVTAEGYTPLSLTATLTINKAVFTGITFADAAFIATGTEKTISVSGELPEGTQVTYTNNSATKAGVYNATAVITNPNYVTLTLNAVLTVNGISAVASEIVNSLLEKPDPWSFMQIGLSRENMAYTSEPVSDFTEFVNTSRIGTRIIGKQLHVLYEGLIYTSNLLGYIDNVNAVAATVAELYQTYINSNPDDYRQFTGEAGGFKCLITLDGEAYTLLAGNSVVSIELFYDKQTGERTGRIQLTDGMALKYEAGENSFKFAVKATIAGAGNLKQIEFIRNDTVVTGYMYEYTGTEAHALKTSAVIASNPVKTVIMSNKRETDDLLINGYEEVYNSQTGKFIGGEVQETVKAVDYDTLWFMLNDVSGLTSIKVTPEQNGMNADTVYINGASASISTKLVGGLSLRATSRRYDIEMKDVWYVIATTENGKTKYETVKYSIPMLFVQKDQTDTFGKDILSKNPSEFTSEPALPSYTAVTADYAVLQSTFNAIKEQLSYAEITGYIGDKNTFFEN